MAAQIEEDYVNKSELLPIILFNREYRGIGELVGTFGESARALPSN